MKLFSKEKVVGKVLLIDVNDIVPNPAQPRTVFNDDELASLSQSIKENGILQPLTVRKNRYEQYELISGERRLKAAKLAGFQQVPCVIVEKTEQQSAILALVENLQREDLNFFEEAKAIHNLITEWNFTQEQAAKRLGKAQSTIANKLRLLKFNENQMKKIISAGLTERHARAIIKINDDETRDKVIYYVSVKKLNVAQTEEYVEKVLSEKPKTKRIYIPIIKDVRIFLNTINKAIDTMEKAGVRIESKKIQSDKFIEYIVTIPI